MVCRDRWPDGTGGRTGPVAGRDRWSVGTGGLSIGAVRRSAGVAGVAWEDVRGRVDHDGRVVDRGRRLAEPDRDQLDLARRSPRCRRRRTPAAGWSAWRSPPRCAGCAARAPSRVNGPRSAVNPSAATMACTFTSRVPGVTLLNDLARLDLSLAVHPRHLPWREHPYATRPDLVDAAPRARGTRVRRWTSVTDVRWAPGSSPSRTPSRRRRRSGRRGPPARPAAGTK